jgi:cell division transport system permease protein
MSAWLRNHFEAFRRAMGRTASQPLASLLSIFVIAIALMLPLGLYSVFVNVTDAASRLNTTPNVNVYLQVAATLEDARATEARLKTDSNAAEVKFVPRETALAEMKKSANIADLISGLENNPLPHAFAIRPKSTEPEALDRMKKDLAALPKVELVVMDFEWAKKLTRFARFAERLVLLLAALLAAAVVFVTGNTIRLQMLTQKEEIAVARLIGATKRFVRRPFLYFGALQGALAGLVSVLAVIGLITWMGVEVNALAASYGADFALRAPNLAQSAIVVAIGALLGWIGAFVSVSLYWRQIDVTP